MARYPHPAGVVAERGMEYWMEVQTLDTLLTDPPVDPSLHPLANRANNPIIAATIVSLISFLLFF